MNRIEAIATGQRDFFRERDAYHESGHATVAVLLGVATEGIELLPPGTHPVASAKFKLGKVTREQHDLIPVVCLAGRIAELAHDPSAPEEPRRRDMLIARRAMRGRLDLLFPASRQEYLKACELSAVELVAKHWPVIEALARELLSKGKLSGQEVESFVRRQISGQPDSVADNRVQTTERANNMNERTEQPLAARLAAILELPPDATDGDITGRLTDWAAERRRQQTAAAFERRVNDLIRVTNMTRQCAIETLQAQDAAARAATA